MRNRRTRQRLVAALTGSVLLMLPACGGGDTAEDSAAPTGGIAGTSTAAPSPAPATRSLTPVLPSPLASPGTAGERVAGT